MIVRVVDLVEGCILEEDVLGKSKYPLITKNTVIEPIHLEVLHAFFIKEVMVSPTLVNGDPFGVLPITDKERSVHEEEESTVGVIEETYVDTYLRAVSHFKKQFIQWQSGSPVDVVAVRSLLLPLLDYIETNELSIATLHHFSTKQDYLYHHAVSTGIISGMIGNKLGLDKGLYVQLALAGALADCGMSKVSNKILHLNRSLNETEYKEIKQHTVYSYSLLKDSPFLKTDMKVAIFQHHERVDGSGYPTGERGERIHLYAQIIAVADVFHAMTSERIYRSKKSPYKVLEMLAQDSFGEYDSTVLQALIQLTCTFTPGTTVRLSTGDEATVMYTKTSAPLRPLVKLAYKEEYIDLEKQRDLYIESM